MPVLAKAKPQPQPQLASSSSCVELGTAQPQLVFFMTSLHILWRRNLPQLTGKVLWSIGCHQDMWLRVENMRIITQACLSLSLISTLLNNIGLDYIFKLVTMHLANTRLEVIAMKGCNRLYLGRYTLFDCQLAYNNQKYGSTRGPVSHQCKRLGKFPEHKLQRNNQIN